QEGALDALQAIMAARGTLTAQPERPGRDREVVHQDEEVPGRVERRVGAERGEGRAARVHVGGGLEHADGYTVHLTLGDASALVAAYSGPGLPRPTTARKRQLSLPPLGFSAFSALAGAAPPPPAPFASGLAAAPPSAPASPSSSSPSRTLRMSSGSATSVAA